MNPITVRTTIARPIDRVWTHLDVLANHEAFCDHMLVDWRLAGPTAGVGAVADVRVKRPGPEERVRIEIVEVNAPHMSLERTVGRGGRRVTTGRYTLDSTGDGGTEVAFTLSVERVPAAERMLLPLLRPVLRRGNQRAMERLKSLLENEGAPA